MSNILASFALEIENLKKVYSGGTEALKGISLKVQEGDFYALLGPNGAGKSSTIGIIGTVVTKTSGKVKIFNMILILTLQQQRPCSELFLKKLIFLSLKRLSTSWSPKPASMESQNLKQCQELNLC